ncbi:hypothetical protein SUGI_0317720 [Cryptomeria japonica]|nr:hypothetical protein SUGI_0317720 [Cryptomeria japonica]
MNKEKSQVYFLNTSRQVQVRIARHLEYQIDTFPIKYLGVLINTGSKQSQIWEEVINKCKAKSAQWKNRWLSQVGRLTMIKSVLSAIPIYSMSCFRMSYLTSKKLDGMLKKFIWEGAKEERRIPLINWDTACLVKEEGGAGLRKMDLQNVALGAKLAWKIYKFPKRLWCRLFRSKYLDSEEPDRIFNVVNGNKGSAVWNFLWEFRNIITDHLSWQVRNGRKAKFWDDSWEGEKPLRELFEDQNWVNEVVNIMGNRVGQYFEGGGQEGDRVVWKKIGIGSRGLLILIKL